MKKTKLIPLDSPLYMKRVVREVRRMMTAGKSVHIVVDSSPRKVVEVEIYKFSIRVRVAVDRRAFELRYVSACGFRDCDGDEITASRTERNNDE